MELSKSAERVQQWLTQRKVRVEVVELPASTRTAEEAAKAIGCEVAQIAKSLIFRTKKTNRPILVLISGVHRVDEKKVSAAVGEEIVKADADFTRETTGFAIGGIPPIGHKQKIETLIDADLLKHQDVWAAAGTPHAVFSIASSDLVKLSEGKVLTLS